MHSEDVCVDISQNWHWIDCLLKPMKHARDHCLMKTTSLLDRQLLTDRNGDHSSASLFLHTASWNLRSHPDILANLELVLVGMQWQPTSK